VIRRRFNRIEILQNSKGEGVVDATEVKDMVRNYFQTLFTGEDSMIACATVHWGQFPNLTEEKHQMLAELFTIGDVFKALKAIALLKAPGPDDFHAYFFQRFWGLVGLWELQSVSQW